MLFLNISSNEIFVDTLDKTYSLSHKNLERTLADLLSNIYKKKFYKNIFVVNGPGAFTSLRIGVLCINMLNFIYDNQINIWTISKIDLYQSFVNNGFLFDQSIIYIGQRQNVWLYDFNKKTSKIMLINDIESLKFDYFVDELYGELRDRFDLDKFININYNIDSIEILFKGQTNKILIEDFDIESKLSISPNYMINPNISQSKK